MKEQILTLERTDDLHSLRDKIRGSQAGRLLLQWPALEKPVTSRLDLELLRRWAEQAGSELILISTDPDVHCLAGIAGIQCYPSLAIAALACLRPTRIPLRLRKKRMPLKPYRSRQIIRPATGSPMSLPPAARACTFALALLGVAAIPLLLAPSAEVHAAFPARSVERSIHINPSSAIPLTVHLTLEGRRPTTGRVRAPTAFATGTIELTNTGSLFLSLPAGIRIGSEDGILFETTDGVAVPAGGNRTVSIRAVNPGIQSNLKPGTLNNIVGSLALSLTADNPLATAGGAERLRYAISRNDVEELRKELTSKTHAQMESELEAAGGDGMELVKNSFMVEFDPSDQPDYPPGTAVDSVGLILHASITAYAFPVEEISSLAGDTLHRALAAGETLAKDSISYEIRMLNDGGFELFASGTAIYAPELHDAAYALRGRAASHIPTFLRERYGSVGEPKITLQPDWLPILPIFDFRIRFLAEPGVIE